jgi:iron complex outermembrane receptor protein
LRYDHESSSIFSNYQITRADAYATPPGGVEQLDALLEQIQIPALPVFRAIGVVPGTGTGKSVDAKYHAVLPKAGLRYALTHDVNVFLTYTEAYRAGGGDVDTQNGDIVQYDPEYTSTFETGIRAAWFDRRLQTRANVYHTRWRDQQVQVADESGTGFYTQNAADSTLYGVEFENALRIGRASSVYVNVGYAHTQFDNYVNGGNDYSGNRFVNAPLWTGGVGGIARVWNGWFASSSFSYTGTSYTTPENKDRARGDARQLLDARIGYEKNGFSIYAFGRNLLNGDYAVYRYDYVGGTGVPPGRTIGYGAPRAFGVQFDLSFQ